MFAKHQIHPDHILAIVANQIQNLFKILDSILRRDEEPEISPNYFACNFWIFLEQPLELARIEVNVPKNQTNRDLDFGQDGDQIMAIVSQAQDFQLGDNGKVIRKLIRGLTKRMEMA